MIKIELVDLKIEIKKISEDEKEIEKPYEIINLVKMILKFNNQNQNQEGQGLKILTPYQMSSRLAISLGQLKSGNNLKPFEIKIR